MAPSSISITRVTIASNGYIFMIDRNGLGVITLAFHPGGNFIGNMVLVAGEFKGLFGRPLISSMGMARARLWGYGKAVMIILLGSSATIGIHLLKAIIEHLTF